MTRWSRIQSGILAITLLLVGSIGGTAQPQDGKPTLSAENRIALTGRCLHHLDAYRGAIAFLDKRLKRSPPAVTFEFKTGDSITLLNRAHRLLQLEKRVLESGFHSRERACKLALKG